MGFSLGNALFGDTKTRGTQGLAPFYTGYGKNSSWIGGREYSPPTGYMPSAQPQFGPSSPNAPQQPSMVAPAPASPDYGLSPEVAAAIQSDPAVAQYFASLQSAQGGLMTGNQSPIPPPPPGYQPPMTQNAAFAYSGGGDTSSGLNKTAPGGGSQLSNYYYDYTKNNTIPTKLSNGSTVPGIAPSAAANYLEGPTQYYPGETVAPYSDFSNEADMALRNGLMDPRNSFNQARNIADHIIYPSVWGQQAKGFTDTLIGRADEVYNNLITSQPNIVEPKGDVKVGSYGLKDFIGPYGKNPYMEQVIGGLQGDAQRYLNETLLPQDRSAATAAGQYGGSRSGIAEGLTRTRVGEELLQQTGNLRYGDYDNYLKNKLSAGGTLVQGDIGAANAAAARYAAEAQYALGQKQIQAQALRDVLDFNARVGGIANTGAANNLRGGEIALQGTLAAGDQALKGNTLLAAAGERRQAQDQARIDADKSRWDFGQNAPTAALQTYANILSGAPQAVSQPGTPTTTRGTGLLDYVKAGGDIVAAFSGMPSFGGGGGRTDIIPGVNYQPFF